MLAALHQLLPSGNGKSLTAFGGVTCLLESGRRKNDRSSKSNVNSRECNVSYCKRHWIKFGNHSRRTEIHILKCEQIRRQPLVVFPRLFLLNVRAEQDDFYSWLLMENLLLQYLSIKKTQVYIKLSIMGQRLAQS